MKENLLIDKSIAFASRKTCFLFSLRLLTDNFCNKLRKLNKYNLYNC